VRGKTAVARSDAAQRKFLAAAESVDIEVDVENAVTFASPTHLN
jgi:hypothetical protein